MVARSHRLVWGTFRELEQAFLAHMRQLRAPSRLSPCAVLVPNHLLRLHLRRALADAGCPHANVHFLTFRNLADRLAGVQLALDNKRPLPRAGFEMRLAMARAVRELADRIGYFRPVLEREGLHRAMLATFRELKEAGIAPEDLEGAARSMRGRTSEEILRTKLEELILLWEHVERAKADAGFYDDPDLLAAAAVEAERSAWLTNLACLVVYGVYDLTGSQRRLLEVCFEDAPATVYFPFGETEAFRYARPAFRWFSEIGFTTAKAEPVQDDSEGSLATEQQVLIVSAPGEARETEEIVREVVRTGPAPADETPQRIGVLIRSGSQYVEFLRESLSVSDVSGHFHGGVPLSQTTAGTSLLFLAELVGSRLRRTEVMDFAVTARPDLASHWNQLTIQAGIVEGRAEWRARLDHLWAKLQQRRERGESVSDETFRDLDALRDFIRMLLDKLQVASSQRTWKQFANIVESLFSELVPADGDTEQVLAHLRRLSDLDVMAIAPTDDQFRAFLREALEMPTHSRGRFEETEPTVVGDLMQARGVPFDVVILPGMVEKGFPQPVRQDPILLDAERRRLTAVLARRDKPVVLPLKRSRQAEEELLFTLAVQAAKRRLVLTFPRLDVDNARPRIPSHFLLRLIKAITGQYADFERLERFIRSDRRGRFVQMSRLDPSVREHAVTALEYDLSSLEKARRDDTPDALQYLTQTTPFFQRALEAESRRWDKPDFSSYEGLIRSPELLRKLGQRLPDAVSATQLELYARCPFAYFLRHLLAIEPIEEPERTAELSPRDRGSIVHHILWQFLSDVVRDGKLPPTEALWIQLEAIARSRFAAFERHGLTGYPLTWRIQKDQILADLREFLEREANEDVPFAPAHFEVRFGMRPRDDMESPMSTERPALFDLDATSKLLFRGKIDRIDVDPAGRRCRIVDYKTGRASAQPDNSFAGGTALQLPVYLVAARALLKSLEPDHAQYYFATTRGRWKRVHFTSADWPAKMETLRLIVRTILDGIRSGTFYPRPDTSGCEYCDLRGTCGHGRFLDFKWSADQRVTSAFKKMIEIE